MYQIGEARFNVGLQRINSLSNVRAPRTPCHALLPRAQTPSSVLLPSLQAWNIYAAPGALLALWVMERAGLRTSLLYGYGTQLVCAVVAYVAVAAPMPPRAAFGVLYASQVLGSLGQPLLMNNVTRISGDWFPALERDAAVCVALLCSAAGSVFISLFAPAEVTSPDQVTRLFAWQVPTGLEIVAKVFQFTTLP